MNDDEEPLAGNADVAPVKFWLHALFSQIDITVKDTLVATSNNTYSYKAYIEMLLSFGTESKENQLSISVVQTTFLWTNTMGAMS